MEGRMTPLVGPKIRIVEYGDHTGKARPSAAPGGYLKPGLTLPEEGKSNNG